MKTDEPMRNINPFGLRLQPDLKAQLEDAANDNKRSLNAEITARLQESFEEKAFSEGKQTVLELKTLMTEISLISALLAMVQQQPQSQERDVVLKQLIDRVDAMGDIQKLFTELMRALPIKQPEQLNVEAHDDQPSPAAKKGSRPLGTDPK